MLTVADNAPVGGMVRARGKTKVDGFGIGLANVRDRLAARYGDAASITSGPVAGGGYETQLRIPLVHLG